MLRLLGGWLERVVIELGDAGSNEFLVSPKYYAACFAKFKDAERLKACAIADLSDLTEPTSLFSGAGVDMSVSERIVLVSGKQLFDDEALLSVFRTIRSHVERPNLPGYRIFIARSDDSGAPLGHPFKGSMSQDILLISPDLVGGYETVDGQPFLRVVASQDTYVTGMSYYKAVKRIAFPFDPEWQEAAEIRSAWLERESRVGSWDASWNYEHRNAAYYDLYDFHIRAWVPGYEDFILTTAVRVVEAMLRVATASDQNQVPVQLLEIGSGTGGLTTRLLNAVQRSRAASQAFGSLFSIDKAPQMVEATTKAVARCLLSDKARVFRGLAFSGLPREVEEGASFGVICGSLVLSHLLRSDAAERLDPLLEASRQRLVKGGSLVFADALIGDPSERVRIREQWRKSMVHNGLPPARAHDFLEHNQEMLSTVTFEELEAAARRHGFELKVEDIPGFLDSPFRTITLTLVD